MNHYRACCLDRVESVRQFIQSGGDINLPDAKGWTPLFYVVYYASFKTFEYLLGEPSVDWNRRDRLGRNLLYYFGARPFATDVAELPLWRELYGDETMTAIMRRVKEPRLTFTYHYIVQRILSIEGFNLYSRDKDGFLFYEFYYRTPTPMNQVVNKNYIFSEPFVRLMLTHPRIRLDYQDPQSNTFLHHYFMGSSQYALETGNHCLIHKDTVDLLLDQRFVPLWNTGDHEGLTPIHHLIGQSMFEVIHLLFEVPGIRWDAITMYEETYLLYFLTYCSIDTSNTWNLRLERSILYELIDRCDRTRACTHNSTPFLILSQEIHLYDFLIRLIQKENERIPMDWTDNDGDTSLICSGRPLRDHGSYTDIQYSQYIHAVRWMLSKADRDTKNLPNRKGKTAVYYALKGGIRQTVRLYLADPDIDLTVRDTKGRPLTYALFRANDSYPFYCAKKWKECFLSDRFDMNQEDPEGNTVIHWIAGTKDWYNEWVFGYMERFKDRIQWDRQNAMGQTALDIATGPGGNRAFRDTLQRILGIRVDRFQNWRHDPPADTTVCSICQEDITDDCVKTPCSHYYHGTCIGEWMSENDTCPMCRTEILEEEVAEEVPELTSMTIHEYFDLEITPHLRGYPEDEDSDSEEETTE